MAGKRMTRKFSRFRALEARDRWMLLHATVWLAMARVMLLVMPFRKLAAALSGEHDAGSSAPDPELLNRIGYAVGAAAGRQGDADLEAVVPQRRHQRLQIGGQGRGRPGGQRLNRR